MPDRHVWIRKDDLYIWESLKDKPQFIHEALQLVALYNGRLPVTFLESKDNKGK